MIAIETSSYLPLIWNTPYTPGIKDLLVEHAQAQNCELMIHRDSIREAFGYLSALTSNSTEAKAWMYDPAFRARYLADHLDFSDPNMHVFPSLGVQVLAGGSIWPAAKYLNYSRHCIFLFSDLLDDIDSQANPRDNLLKLGAAIEERSTLLTKLFELHLASTEIELPSAHVLPYWGRHFSGQAVRAFQVRVLDDSVDASGYATRDAFHYAMAQNALPLPAAIIVADQGFKKNVRDAKLLPTIPILTAESWKIGGKLK